MRNVNSALCTCGFLRKQQLYKIIDFLKNFLALAIFVIYIDLVVTVNSKLTDLHAFEFSIY